VIDGAMFKIGAISLFFLVSPLAAQEISTPPANRIVLSGERVRIGFSYDLNPNCSSRGEVKSRLLEKPKNGEVETATERGFSLYDKDDQRYKCNEKETDILSYYYKPRHDFKGKDRLVIEVFFPSGAYRKRLFNIDVR
jgi:hypothetical protein